MTKPESETKKWPEPEQLLALLPEFLANPQPDLYLSDNYTVLDFETTTRDYGTPHDPENSLLCAVWKNGPAHPRPGMYRAVGDEFHMLDVVADVSLSDFYVAHNSKFECGWLERCGMNIATNLPFCTMLAELALAGNRQWGLKLKDCLDRREMPSKDVIGTLIVNGVDTRNIPMPWLLHYCGIDVERTEALFLDQRQSLKRALLLPVAFTRNILTPVLYDIEGKGLHLDKDRVYTVYNYFESERKRLEGDWNELTGGVNVNSPKQKRELLYETLSIPVPDNDMGKPMQTPKGEPATDAAAINAMRLTTQKQKDVVGTLRNLAKVKGALSKYVNKLKDCADNEGILTANFLQNSAGTHRLASSGRNYNIQHQNFQNRFRPVVAARRKGWFMGDGDSAGIEFRTAVDLARDEQGLADISGGVDVHSNTASIVFLDEWDGESNPKSGRNKTLRKAAKPHTFKPLYGGESGTERQRAYYSWFRERYQEINRMQTGWADTVLRRKCLRTATGLQFYWPNAKVNRRGELGWPEKQQVYDYPIQSFATAEMCPTASVYLWHIMRAVGMESFLVALVHDSAVGEIHPDERDPWAAYLQYCFNKLIVWYLRQVYDYEWVTPLASEVNIFPHWDDAEPVEWLAQWEIKTHPKPV